MLGWWGRLLLGLRNERIGVVVEGGVEGLIVVRGVVCGLFDRIRGAHSRKARATYWGVVGMLSVRGVRMRGSGRKAEKGVVLGGSCVVLIVHSLSGSFAAVED